MPRVTHVKAARKDNPVCKKGQSYYWWKFPYGRRLYSLTYPRASQLTQSAYFGTAYDLIDEASSFQPMPGEEGVIEDFAADLSDQITQLADECQESLDNMPESLTYAPTGELLQERIDACQAAADEVSAIEEPQEWQVTRDAQEEHLEWENNEPVAKDFKLNADGDDVEYQDAKSDWEADEPEVEEFEEFDNSEIVSAIENIII